MKSSPARAPGTGPAMDGHYPPGSQTAAARLAYAISPYTVPLALIRSTLLVKLAACRCNARLGYLDVSQAERLERAIDSFRLAGDAELAPWFDLDAFQGGAGTSINMNVNEALVERDRQLAAADAPDRAPAGAAAGRDWRPLDPYRHANLHQSTNDVMPTALRLMLLDQLAALEPLVGQLQAAAQEREQAHAGSAVVAHTQLQDALAMDAGRIFATWAGALQRDRWRIFKARERLKEVNLGGTAIGTGAGAPRQYVLGVIRQLQALTPHPVSRADDPVEATSNYDCVAEAMGAANVLAQTVKRIAGDIRLLASGPSSGMGLLKLPPLVKGSSIMPGKVNPVLAEAAVQVAERVMANDALIGRLCASTELQLNAFFPLIAFTVHESLTLLSGLLPALGAYIHHLGLDADRAAGQVAAGRGGSLALLPLLGYQATEALVQVAREAGISLRAAAEATGWFSPEDLELLFSPRMLGGMGYNEADYQGLAERLAARRGHPPAIG